MSQQATFGNRVAPWRFAAFFLILALSAVAAITWLDSVGLGLMAAFDVAAATFLALHLQFLRIGDPASMRQLAEANDANRTLLLVISGIVVATLLIAVGSQSVDQHQAPVARALIIPTLILLWLFSNSVFALHYAHMGYIQRGKAGSGFRFPGTPNPLYWDFLYLAFTFGSRQRHPMSRSPTSVFGASSAFIAPPPSPSISAS